jgi:hypothetical protein
MSLPPNILDKDRLAKILGRLGSSFDGERAAAAAKADELIRAAGLTWTDVLYPPPEHPAIRSHIDAADQCLDAGVPLSDWDRAFLSSMERFHRLSDRQYAFLRRLCVRCGVRWP